MGLKDDWEEFDTNYAKYLELHTTEINPDLSRIRIKLQLYVGTKISFSSEYDYFKTEIIKDIYRLQIKQSELWSIYEMVTKFCIEKKYLEIKNIFGLINKNICIDFNSYLKEFNSEFSKEIINIPSRFFDFKNNYLVDLKDDKQIKGLLRSKIQQLNSAFSEKFVFNNENILALIYANRNQIIHTNAELKSGVKQYRTKIAVLKSTEKYLNHIIINILNQILLYEINNIIGE